MDVFISYRRDTGSSQAALIAEKLKNRKINAFLDRHRIHNEDFFEKLICNDFCQGVNINKNHHKLLFN